MKKYSKLILMMILAMTVGILGGCGTKNTGVQGAEKNRLEKILERGYIEVTTEPYFAPYEFIDPAKKGNEQYVGSDMELAKYIAEKLGVELKVVPLEFSAVLGSITEKKYDLAISALSYTPARIEAMNMSKGYYFPEENAGHGILVREEDLAKIKGPADLSDKTVVVQSGSLQELFLTEQVPKTKEVKRVSATTDGFLMVQEKKADAIITMIPMAKLYIEANKDCGLAIVEGFEFTQDESTAGTRIGIPLGEDELTEKMNEIIDEVVSEGLFEKWQIQYTDYAKSLGL